MTTKVVTFYSYKGGVGRTLLLANVAVYLTRFGRRVFAIDFDLEAPGLHHKLLRVSPGKPGAVKNGLVNYLSRFRVDGKAPTSLRDYVVEVDVGPRSSGSLFLMPAGDVPSATYWRKLSQLNWYDLFYSDTPRGIPLFLDLLERIKEEFSPDFVLIDSRTGVTEIGGVATTVLADLVVCLVLNNAENLEGAREVLRSIRRAGQSPGGKAIDSVVVLARIPKLDDPTQEASLVGRVRAFLNESAESIADTLSIEDVLVLHSEPALEIAESILIGSGISPTRSALVADYLRLMARIVPQEVLDEEIQELLKEATASLLDDPDRVQAELEALAEYSAHAEVYRQLLKFYLLRGTNIEVVFDAALRYVATCGNTRDELVWQIVQYRFVATGDLPTARGELAASRAVWRTAGDCQIGFGLRLAQAYRAVGERSETRNVLKEVIEKNGPIESAVVQLINEDVHSREYGEALGLVRTYTESLKGSVSFAIARGRLAGATNDVSEARALIETDPALFDSIRREAPAVAAELLMLVGEKTKAFEPLEIALMEQLKGRRPDIREVAEIQRAYLRYGESERFVDTVRRFLPKDEAARLLATLRRWA